MKTKLFCALATLTLAISASADEQVRNVQTELKSQGFYYGEVDGQSGPEMASAIRRYQIRNGLEVTGSLTPETLTALGMIAGKPKSSAPEVPAAPVARAQEPPRQPATAKGPVNIRRDGTAEDSDREFLQREEGKDRNRNRTATDYNNEPAPSPPAPQRNVVPAYRDPSIVSPPAPLDAPSPDFPVIFSGTPYANAPLAVQQDTLRRAQAILASRGYYRDIVDGLPGPATEEALLSYQRSTRLTLTGRLDIDTLNELRLLPGNNRNIGESGNGGTQFGFEFHTGRHVFRGVWVGH
ncbi:MAG TPA: peptidoglycan-binding protein [Chthoniobacter sp.]|nr:peptidoglycan-binding protein [Chthoniobacter sp.]